MKKLESFLKRKNIFFTKEQNEKVWIFTSDLSLREPYIIKKLFMICFNNKIDVRISANYITLQQATPKVKQLKK